MTRQTQAGFRLATQHCLLSKAVVDDYAHQDRFSRAVIGIYRS